MTELQPANGAMTEERNHIFDRWLADHRGILFKVLRAYADTRQDQDDLFQEICVRLWLSAPQYLGQSAETTWIYRVALFAALDWFRSEKRHDRLEPVEPLEGVLSIPEHANDPRVEWLYARIRELDEVDRSLVLLQLDGFTYSEMAEILGISASNVGVKLHRIKKRLKSRLNSEEDGGP